MPELTSTIINLTLTAAACFFFYRAGKHGERAKHYEWMSEGWRMLADHIDFIMITKPTHQEALEKHLIYMTDVFSMNRPYPPQKKQEKEETVS